MITAPNLAELPWLIHGFGDRDSRYPASIKTLKQIHSAVAVDVVHDAGDAEEGDALVSNQPGIVVGIKTADCVPVLIVDVRTRAVAAIHAGWRGTAAEIVPKTVRELLTRFGGRAEDLHAAIGPAIGVCCYEVSPDVARQFGTWLPEMNNIEAPVKLDLTEVNRKQLQQSGVPDVWAANACTFCNPRFFSFRREKQQAGRMLSFIGQRGLQ